MTIIVAVAGGTGGLGRAIVEGLKADGRYEVLVLSRGPNPKFEEENEVRVLDTKNYSNVDHITTLLEQNKISAVIATLNITMDATPELNLIEAAERANTTKRYVPSLFSGVAFTEEHAKNHFIPPFAARHFKVTETLRNTSLEFAAIHPGVFMDYYVPLPTYVTIFPLMVSLSAKFAAIPGSGTTPLSFTHTSSIGKYMAHLLSKPSATWQERYFISDDNKSLNDVVALAEKHMGAKFEVVYDSLERLREGKVTEVPGYEVIYESLGGGQEAKGFVLGWFSAYGQWIERGDVWYREGPLLSEEFGNVVEKLTMEKAWEKAGKGV